MLNYEIGDVVKMKKKHPCGSDEWEILKTGIDFKMRCVGCGHEIILRRLLVEKNTKMLKKGCK